MEYLFQLFIGIVSSTIVTFIMYFVSLGKYKEKINRTEHDLHSIHGEVNSIHRMISGIHSELAALKEFKEHAKKFIDSKLYQSNSPLSLTDEGKRLVRESGFEAIFEIVKDDLCGRLSEQQGLKTRYDVQEKARGFMDDFSREDYQPFMPIKSYAFEKGEDYAQILRAGSILLRDYYISLHPEIKY